MNHLDAAFCDGPGIPKLGNIRRYIGFLQENLH